MSNNTTEVVLTSESTDSVISNLVLPPGIYAMFGSYKITCRTAPTSPAGLNGTSYVLAGTQATILGDPLYITNLGVGGYVQGGTIATSANLTLGLDESIGAPMIGTFEVKTGYGTAVNIGCVTTFSSGAFSRTGYAIRLIRIA